MQGSDGNFYGTTGPAYQAATKAYNKGTIFRMSANGALATIASIPLDDSIGENPTSLNEGADGNFYGITEGDSYAPSTVFRVTPGGQLQAVYKTPSGARYDIDGYDFQAQLLSASDGNFYGTADTGGDAASCANSTPGCGTFFTVSPSGSFKLLTTFMPGAGGQYPGDGLVQGTHDKIVFTTGSYNANSSSTTSSGTFYSADLCLAAPVQ